MKHPITVLVFALFLPHFLSVGAFAADQPQWGEYGTRNMISGETGLPDSFNAGNRDSMTGLVDPTTTKNVRWTAPVGEIVYGTPIVAEGKVFVGVTDSMRQEIPQLQGDRGVLVCLDEKTGEFLWELVTPKRTNIKFSDWDRVGICSPPAVENGQAYLMTNRCEILCLDINGQADGNQGPFLDEAAYSVPEKMSPLTLSDKDADIIWMNDLTESIGAMSHNAANCAILIDGDCLYVCTSNGVDWTHKYVINPDAPTLIVLDKKTGKVIARDDFQIGPDIAHGQWSSPAMGMVNGKKLIFQGTGSGYFFAVEALTTEEVEKAKQAEAPVLLKNVWRFNGHPLAQTQEEKIPIDHQHDSTSFQYTANPVFYDNRIYVVCTQEQHHGMKEGWLVCLDATKTGDITRTGGLIWSYKDMTSSDSTVAIADGLLYVADGSGTLHCLDAKTGKPRWTHRIGGPVWASPLVADSKVYIGTGRRTFWVFAHGTDKKVLSEIRMPDGTFCTATAANKTLYVSVNGTLYAVGND